MNTKHATFLPSRLRQALIAILLSSIGWSPAALSAEPPPLPAGVRLRLAALLDTAKAAKAVCVNTEELANLVLAAPDYVSEIITVVAHAVSTMVPPVAATPVAGAPQPIRNQPGESSPRTNDESQCNCLAEIAGAVIAVIPNRSAQVYQALAEITPQCSAVVGNRIRQVLLSGQPAPTAAASSGNMSPTEPLNFCAYGGLCSPPLQHGDNPAESPTRLRGRG